MWRSEIRCDGQGVLRRSLAPEFVVGLCEGLRLDLMEKAQTHIFPPGD